MKVRSVSGEVSVPSVRGQTNIAPPMCARVRVCASVVSLQEAQETPVTTAVCVYGACCVPSSRGAKFFQRAGVQCCEQEAYSFLASSHEHTKLIVATEH